ncbi:MAG: ABC transporter permease [Actinomycetota bacterium]|nr:ABC transporter permease [Actinomycetota bacterium]
MDKKVRVYDAEFSLPDMKIYVSETKTHLRFALEKAKLDLKAANKNTWLGQLWNVMNPLLLSLVYWLLLVVIVGNGGSIFALDGVQRLTQIVGGLFLYRLVSTGLMSGAKSIISGGAFVLNTRLPRLILPLAAVISSFLSFLPSMLLYVLFHIVSRNPIVPELLWTIPVTAILLLLTTGLAMLTATGNVYFRDIASFLPYVTRIWLYLTPILYLYSEMPSSVNWMIYANPLGAIFVTWQQVIFEGITPGITYLLTGLAWSVGLFLIGFFMFLRKERDFAIRI